MRKLFNIFGLLFFLTCVPAYAIDKKIAASNTFKFGIFDISSSSNGLTGLTLSDIVIKVQCSGSVYTIDESGDTLTEEGGGYYRLTANDTLTLNNEDECFVWTEGAGDYTGLIAKAPVRFKVVGTTVDEIATNTWSVGTRTITGGTVTTNSDKTGYSLTQSFPTNFSNLAITGEGAVTAGTVSDKTGYSVSTVQDKTGYSITGTVTDLDTLQSNIKGSLGASINLTKLAQKDTGGAFNADTDSLEAVRDRGDVAWTGGGASAADVWAYSTRALTSSSDPTAAQIADAVWDEARTGHTTAGTFGYYLDAPVSTAGGGGSSDWTTDEKNQIRYRLGIDGTTAAPSTNQPQLGYAKEADYTATRAAKLDNLDAAITTRQPSGNVTVGGYAAGQSPADSVLATPENKLATDGSGAVTVGNNTDKAGYWLADGAITAAKIATDAITADKIAAGAITSSEAPNLDAAISSRQPSGNVTVGGYASGQDPATLLLSSIVDGKTVKQILCGLAATAMGKSSGMGTTTVTFRNLQDTGTAVTGTMDSNYNRTAVTLTLTGCN